MVGDLQFGCFLFISSKQRRLVKVQWERSGLRMWRRRKVTTNCQLYNQQESSTRLRISQDVLTTVQKTISLLKTLFWGQYQASDWPGKPQNIQQQLFMLLVLLYSASVQLEGRLLEERQSFSQRSKLYQVHEVEVSEPLGPLTTCQLWIKALSKLWHVVSPLLLKPAVWRKEWWLGGVNDTTEEYQCWLCTD